jgi:hypothetical protein
MSLRERETLCKEAEVTPSVVLAQHEQLFHLLNSLLPTSVAPEDQFDPRHFQRDRVFTVDVLTFSILHLISDQNNFGYQHILQTLWKKLKELELVAASDPAPQKSSFCKARRKLPEKYIKEMFSRAVERSNQVEPQRLWKGHRLFAVDGMKVSLPLSAELKEHFGCPKVTDGEAHYPQALLSELFNVLTDEVNDFTLSPYTANEREQAILHLSHLREGDIMINDRNYPSYELFWECRKRKIHFVMRMPLGHWKIIEEFLASGAVDQCVTLNMTTRARELYKNDPTVPKQMTVRLIRVTLTTGETEVLVTSLLNRKKYPTKALQELYPLRWPIEEGNKSVKCHQAIEKFHAKDVNGIHQEVNAHYLLMAITRLFMLQAAITERTSEQYYGLSYKSAVDFVSNDLVVLVLSKKQRLKKKTITEILIMIAKVYEKPRYHRSYPRWSRCGRRKYRQRHARPAS